MEARLSKAALLVIILSSISTAKESVRIKISKNQKDTTKTLVPTKEIGCKHYDPVNHWPYNRQQSWTYTKKTCQRWDSQTPHRHNHTNPYVYASRIEELSEAENYCRNPGYLRGFPWCFTTDPKKRWEFCDIPLCDGCKVTRRGTEYIEPKQSTGSDACLHWDDTSFHSFKPADFSGGITNLSQAKNYCRNPNNHTDGPWCYTWQSDDDLSNGRVMFTRCDVPFCHGCRQHGFYDGTKTTTKSGLTCQRWDSQSPHHHNVTDPKAFKVSQKYNLTHLNEAENYCRIVDGINRAEPWCYTIANGTEWEYCDVPQCLLQGCHQHGFYDGPQYMTKSGLTCQRWDSQSPHPHNVTDPKAFKVAENYNLTRLNEAEEYCKIVDGINRTEPWCYTTASGTEWEYCDVPQCPE